MTSDIPQGNATYDAAAANMESPWKIFTQAQGQELISNTTYQWTTMNGVNGRKFTNKSDSNKYIFIPAAGYWNNTTRNNAGSYGFYWSTTWRSSSLAWGMNFDSGNLNMLSGNGRCLGFSIRPIQ